MNFRYRPILSAALLLLSGCRDPDPSDALNRDLIKLLIAQDRSGKDPAGKYVIHGARGHLFYLEDLRAALVKAGAFESSLGFIASVSAALKAKSVRLLVVPVPTKVETHPELLGGRNVPHLSLSKGRFLKGLDSLGVEYIDLREAFFAAKDSVRLFPRTDTHWDQPAIRLAAALIATRIRPEGEPAGAQGGTGSRDAGLSDTTLAGFQGDLAEKFVIADSDTIRLQRVGDGRGGILAEPDSAGTILYGDSFLRQYSRYSAHLGAHLTREIGSPVKTVYSLNGFIEGPDRIRERVEAYPGIRTVVWVFTSRSLMEAAN